MFSFTPTKNVTTGEGGIVTTRDEALADKLRLLRNHGQTSIYQHDHLGYNWRITELQAAMGVVQIRKLDAILARKWANAAYLRSHLVDHGAIELPTVRDDRTHGYMLFTLKVKQGLRDTVMRSLIESGIESRLYFPPAHLQPVFRPTGVSLPRTERLAEQMLSIPFHSRLSTAELDTIVDALRHATALS
jgi:perosamine synthetase